MAKVNVVIVDATGNKEQKVGLPDDIKCGIIMVKLVEKIRLPSVGPDGNPISYKFIHKVTGRQLLEAQTLADAGIKDGDVLRLQPEITAGACNLKRIFLRGILGCLLAVLMLSLSGCKSSDYKKASELYENGNWEEAMTIFVELEDYEDSAEMVSKCKYEIAAEHQSNGEYIEAIALYTELGDFEDSSTRISECKWDQFLAYISSQKNVTIDNIDGQSEASVELTAEGSKLLATYTYDASDSGLLMMLTIEINYNDPIASVAGLTKMAVLGAYSDETCAGTLNIDTYTKGGYLVWTTQSSEGKDLYGRATSGNYLLTTDVTASKLEALIGGIEEVIAESGLDITMSDLGFKNY